MKRFETPVCEYVLGGLYKFPVAEPRKSFVVDDFGNAVHLTGDALDVWIEVFGNDVMLLAAEKFYFRGCVPLPKGGK